MAPLVGDTSLNVETPLSLAVCIRDLRLQCYARVALEQVSIAM